MKRWTEDLEFGTRTELVRKLKSFCNTFGDVFDNIILFGSTARCEATRSSDIDIYVDSTKLTSTQLVRDKRFNEFVLGLHDIVKDEIEFDILSFGRNELKSFRDSTLYKQIEKDGVIFYD